MINQKMLYKTDAENILSEEHFKDFQKRVKALNKLELLNFLYFLMELKPELTTQENLAYIYKVIEK